MNVFLQPLSELEELQNALKQLKSNQAVSYTHLTLPTKA